MTRDWYHLHRKFAPLILHHRITTRIVNVPSSKRGSILLRVEVCGPVQIVPQSKTAVADKSPLKFGGALAAEAVFDSSCFE
jgi:hypothetical protein